MKARLAPSTPPTFPRAPWKRKVNIKGLDLTASGFVEPSTGIAGVVDFDGTLNSDGKLARTSGTLKADKLKLAVKGSPATRPVEVKYATDYDMVKQGGTLTQGDVTLGKALAKLTGTYQSQGESTLLNMKLNADGMPVDDLQAMLPALGVILPSGSKLQGGTLSVNVGIVGPVDKLVITGPIRLAQTKLAGFNLASKMSAISALSGAQTGSDTSIQNLSTDARVAPEGVRTQNINLTIPALGTVTGDGTISPGGALNYKMNAALSGSVVTGLTQLAGIGGKGGSVPFFIQGTTSDPKFMPDVKGMVGSQLKGGLGGLLGGATGGKDSVRKLSRGRAGRAFRKKEKTVERTSYFSSGKSQQSSAAVRGTYEFYRQRQSLFFFRHSDSAHSGAIMAEKVPQNFSNHSRLDPPVHFFVLPVFAITIIITLVHLVTHPGLHSAWVAILALAAAVAVVQNTALRTQGAGPDHSPRGTPPARHRSRQASSRAHR